MLSLAMTPARALFDWMPLVQIRRRIGVATALYAGAHFLIFVLDQKWNLIVVAIEIAKRFYLTIGFVTLVMLAALAITSTNGWQRRLKANWRRLHWLIYPAGLIALVHFFIQSKLKIGDRKSTRLNSSHFSLHDALPILEPDRGRDRDRQALLSHHRLRDARHAGSACHHLDQRLAAAAQGELAAPALADLSRGPDRPGALLHPVQAQDRRSEEHTSELQSLFPTRRSSDLGT